MRQMLKDKRGVTPILSNVLLTVVAVAAMSLAASATYIITDNLRQTMAERLVVEDVWFNSNGISIYLRNTGEVAVDVSAVYVNSTSEFFTPLMLEVGDHGWLNVSSRWKADSLYNINVVTSRGTHIVDYYKTA